ncbi:hypothetical protein SAMN05660649_04917 [Desulfotomaculum arcticum]|uniref:Uncharacterized protein n=1 Tax=Desulfotruncus arcticus DSM 17038 TaxID=1121424 RepID=A0A1I2ZG64_9FIRM|nr:hypothetical protein SAMN05660649_04917 [Desulfotomaculum arcticum] [Desulfotruncus arcticus DSM 17038]
MIFNHDYTFKELFIKVKELLYVYLLGAMIFLIINSCIKIYIILSLKITNNISKLVFIIN